MAWALLLSGGADPASFPPSPYPSFPSSWLLFFRAMPVHILAGESRLFGVGAGVGRLGAVTAC